MSARNIDWTDSNGKKYRSLMPEGLENAAPQTGIVYGPPDLSSLGLPYDLEVRLHNQLFDRGIFTFGDAQRRRMDVLGALQSTLKVDVDSVVEAFRD